MTPDTQNTIEREFAKRCKDIGSDIHLHLPALRRYAEQSSVVVEFGVRGGNSTTALLAGGPMVYGYDFEAQRFNPTPDVAARFIFTRADTLTLAEIPECDLLFIDACHTAKNVAAELKHEHRVRKWIIFHDQIEWGTKSEKAGDIGINGAIFPFLAEHKLKWRVAEVSNECMGLLVLERFA